MNGRACWPIVPATWPTIWMPPCRCRWPWRGRGCHVSREVRLAADVGEKTGTLSQSLKKALQQMDDFERVLSAILRQVLLPRLRAVS